MRGVADEDDLASSQGLDRFLPGAKPPKFQILCFSALRVVSARTI